MLSTLTYVSSAVSLFEDDQLYRLLEESRVRNEAHNITGLLLYAHGTFMQTIEGEDRDIDALFGNIVRDRRHQGVIKLVHDELDSRVFAKWSMGFKNGDKNIAGFTDYFDNEHGLEIAGPMASHAKQLLRSFRANMGI